MKDSKKIILIENIIAVIMLITLTGAFFYNYKVSPKIAIAQFVLAVVVALALLIVSAKKSFYAFTRNLIFLFALVPMISFNYIADAMKRQFVSVPRNQIVIVYGVNMLPITLTAVLVIGAYLILSKENKLNKLTYCLLCVAAVALAVSFAATSLLAVLKYLFGVALLVIVISYVDKLFVKKDNHIPQLVILIFLFLRVIHLFISRAYYI